MPSPLAQPPPDSDPSRWRLAPWLLVAAATLALAAFAFLHVREGVFASGDGGLKFLLTRQFAAGRFDLAVPEPTAAWARQLWAAGLAPFGPPFAYPVAAHWQIAFPLLLPLLSAPLWAALGPAGLYLLPLAGVTAALVGTCLMARRLGAGTVATATALCLTLASPLPLYGAMFWEHAPAAGLLALGTAALLAESPRTVTVGGLLVGLAAALRPESLVFVGLLLPALLATRPTQRTPLLWAVAALAVALAGPIGVNLAASGSLTGLHGQQFQFAWRLGWAQEQALLAMLLGCFPALVVAAPAVALGQQPQLAAVARAALGAVLVVPWLVPNTGGHQIGPRYLLIFVPVLAALAATLTEWTWRTQRLRLATPVVLLVLAAATWSGTLAVGTFRPAFASDCATRIAPTLEFLRARPERVIAFSHQWNAQEFAALMDDRVFLRLQRWGGARAIDEDAEVDTERQWHSLVTTLRAHGVLQFLLVTFPEQRVPPVRATTAGAVRFSRVFAAGQCVVWLAALAPAVDAAPGIPTGS